MLEINPNLLKTAKDFTRGEIVDFNYINIKYVVFPADLEKEAKYSMIVSSFEKNGTLFVLAAV